MPQVTIDAHQHFWHPETGGDYGWLSGPFESLNRRFDPHDLRPSLERNGVSGTVLVQAVIEQPGELLRRVVRREIRTAHIADKQRVAGEHREGFRRAIQVRDQDADAFQGMARRFEKPQAALTEADLIALGDRY